ncbi:hypothetical protein OUZ56_001261 [Daphnia magna]|uniref:Uncharacterized protein n=1 Tax=Daphnia magna TaxID=35525 RepID=A0ABR0A243_9CRUS|nr:hypothetical protein OUZ56_001261 [Daphnia magna]
MYRLQPQLKTFESIMGKHAAAILQLRRQQRRTKFANVFLISSPSRKLCGIKDTSTNSLVQQQQENN